MKKCRKDLSKHDEKDLEELKNELTDSLETYEDASELKVIKKSSGLLVRRRVDWFNARTSATESKSVPSSPTENYKFELPVRTNSVSDFSQVEALALNMSDVTKLKLTRQGHKSWVTRTVNFIKKLDSDGKLTLTNLATQENLMNGYINEIKETEKKLSEAYYQESCT